MTNPDPTALLAEWRGGNRAALDELFPLVYEELRRRARHSLRAQAPGHTLTTTALVHETYLKLMAVDRVSWHDRAHFLALAATAMRHVLINYARRNQAAKRGSDPTRVDLDEVPVLTDTGADQILALDEALCRLEAIDERLSRTVVLRYYGGLTIEETSEALGVAPSTVKLDWQKARAWLYREIADA